MAEDGERTVSEPATVPGDAPADPGGTAARRAGPDPVALLAGLGAALVALLALTDALGHVDPRWALAVAGMVAGALLLLSTLRRQGRT